MFSKEYLDNGIICFQRDSAYHFTSDAILLSRFATAKKGEVVADFCSGSGIVGLNFYALNKDMVKSVTLVELQEEMCLLSQKSITENGLDGVFSVENMPVQSAPEKFNGKFSLILCNPPYYKLTPTDDKTFDKEKVCKKELCLTLNELILSVSKCLKYGGRVCFVHLSERLAEIIYAMKSNGIEPKTMQFVDGGKNKKNYLVLIEGVKGGKAGLKIKETVKN